VRCVLVSGLGFLDCQRVFAEEIWLPRVRFLALLDLDLDSKGPLLYPIYEDVCGQVVGFAHESLTAEAVHEVYGRMLLISAD
ncbi:GntR family transcriptional regulator, partial [Pseudomonas syringae pv. tagetis]